MRLSTSALLVVAETREERASALTRELLGLARELAAALNAEVAAVLFASDERAAEDLIAHGADRVYFCAGGPHYEGEVWLPCVAGIAREVQPAAVLAGHTPAGADLAPRLAFRLEAAVATACTGVQAQSGRLQFTRPCYGGNVRETVSFTTACAVATVKAGTGAVQADATRRGEVIRVTPPEGRRRTRVLARVLDGGGAGLETAKVIVAGGRGLEGPEGFRILEGLAAVLGGAVGASRVPCDLGWCPHSWQIGLTGKTVTPELYFAVGISGAGHHMAGCGNARAIVAINTDPEAAIFREARFGLVGDYRKVVPALASALARSADE